MKSYIVLGLGRFGRSMAQTLFDLGYEVLGVDEDEKIVQEFSSHVTYTIQAEVTSEDFLKSIDVGKFDAAVVAVGSNMQVSIMATVLLKELGVKYILVKAQNDMHERILYKVGADKVVLPEKDMGIKAARNLVTDNFFDMIEISSEYSIATISPPAGWVGKTLGELAVRAKHRLNIIAVKDDSRTNVVPNANTPINSHTILTVLGSNDDLKRFRSVR